MKRYLKNKIRKWLGIDENESEIKRLEKLYSDLVSIGIDVHFREPHMILIYSKLNGGQLRHIPVDIGNIPQLEKIVRELKEMYGTTVETWDYPKGGFF